MMPIQRIIPKPSGGFPYSYCKISLKYFAVLYVFNNFAIRKADLKTNYFVSTKTYQK